MNFNANNALIFMNKFSKGHRKSKLTGDAPKGACGYTVRIKQLGRIA